MVDLVHTKNNCTANDLCLGGMDGLFCGNCGAGLGERGSVAMNMKPVNTREEAIDKAIAWQIWASDQKLYMSELMDWYEYFTELAKKFDLREEFEENGIL